MIYIVIYTTPSPTPTPHNHDSIIANPRHHPAVKKTQSTKKDGSGAKHTKKMRETNPEEIQASTEAAIYLSICLSIYLSINLSINQSINQSIYLPFYLSMCLSIYLSIYQSINQSILSVHPSLFPSVSSGTTRKYSYRNRNRLVYQHSLPHVQLLSLIHI